MTITYCRFYSIVLPCELNACVTLCVQVGEDVPDARKCACASHVANIAEFFQVGLAKVKQTSFSSLSQIGNDPFQPHMTSLALSSSHPCVTYVLKVLILAAIVGLAVIFCDTVLK